MLLRGLKKLLVVLQNKKQLFAVVSETLRYRKILEEILDKTKLLKLERKAISSKELALVLLYDYLIGKGFHRAPKNLKVKKAAILNAGFHLPQSFSCGRKLVGRTVVIAYSRLLC